MNNIKPIKMFYRNKPTDREAQSPVYGPIYKAAILIPLNARVVKARFFEF